MALFLAKQSSLEIDNIYFPIYALLILNNQYFPKGKHGIKKLDKHEFYLKKIETPGKIIAKSCYRIILEKYVLPMVVLSQSLRLPWQVADGY